MSRSKAARRRQVEQATQVKRGQWTAGARAVRRTDLHVEHFISQMRREDNLRRMLSVHQPTTDDLWDWS